MTISVDYPTGVISVQKVDLDLVQSTPTVIYNHSMINFWKALRTLEESADGRSFPIIIEYNPPTSVGNILLAPVVSLSDYYTVTYEDDQYAVNLTEANTNIGDRVNVNQVSVRTANSAGLTSSYAIEHASFNDVVTIDENSTNTGTVWPAGTGLKPLANITPDGFIIQEIRGLDTFFFKGNYTFVSGDDITGLTVKGQGYTKSSFVFSDLAVCASVDILGAFISGSLDGGCNVEDCTIGALNFGNGQLTRCTLTTSTLTLGAGDSHMLNCDTNNFASISLSTGSNLYCRNLKGGIVIKDSTDPTTIAFIQADGYIELDSSCTDGNFFLFGTAKLVNNSSVPLDQIDTSGLSKPVESQYGGRIYISTTDPDRVTGSEYPAGLFESPVDNITDALLLARKYNCNELHPHSAVPVPDNTNLDFYVISGHGGAKYPITLGLNVSTVSTIWKNVIIIGALNGAGHYDNCHLKNTINLEGKAGDVVFSGTCALADRTDAVFRCITCHSLNQTPVPIDVGAATVIAIELLGFFEIHGKDDATNEVNIHLKNGFVEVYPTCTLGSILFLGSGHIVDNSSVGCTVDGSHVFNMTGQANAVLDEIA